MKCSAGTFHGYLVAIGLQGDMCAASLAVDMEIALHVE